MIFLKFQNQVNIQSQVQVARKYGFEIEIPVQTNLIVSDNIVFSNKILWDKEKYTTKLYE